MKEYKSGMKDDQKRRERNIRKLPNERINIYLSYDRGNLGCIIKVQTSKFLNIIHRHTISFDN